MYTNLKRKFSNPPIVILDLPQKPDLYNGICTKARNLGWRFLDLRITKSSILPGTNAIGLLTNKLGDNPIVSKFRKRKIPVIRLGAYPHPKFDKIIPAVLPGPIDAGKLAADHFADRQFKKVGFVGNYPWAMEPHLFNAFREKAIAKGCECHLLQLIPVPDYSIPNDERLKYQMDQIKKWLKDVPKPIGVFTYNDLQAATIYIAARNAGFEIPEEIALLGMGNDKTICDLLPVPLSSINMNEIEIGRRAVDLLNIITEGAAAPKRPIMIPPKRIVGRQSTNLLAVPDPAVARALRFIWDHFTEQISIDDIAAATGVARSTITRKFRKCLNHGVNAELRRKRLEKSCELLRSTQMTVAEIAIESGFPSPPYFYMAFQKAFNKTPGEFRKAYSKIIITGQ